VFLFFCERSKNKKRILPKGQHFSFVVLLAPLNAIAYLTGVNGKGKNDSLRVLCVSAVISHFLFSPAFIEQILNIFILDTVSKKRITSRINLSKFMLLISYNCVRNPYYYRFLSHSSLKQLIAPVDPVPTWKIHCDSDTGIYAKPAIPYSPQSRQGRKDSFLPSAETRPPHLKAKPMAGRGRKAKRNRAIIRADEAIS